MHLIKGSLIVEMQVIIIVVGLFVEVVGFDNVVIKGLKEIKEDQVYSKEVLQVIALMVFVLFMDLVIVNSYFEMNEVSIEGYRIKVVFIGGDFVDIVVN